MKVICISGKAQHGKNEAADFIKSTLEEAGKRVVITAYAKAVKDVSKEFFNWDGEKDEFGRSLLQRVGDIGRAYNINYWVDIVADKIMFAKDEWDYVLIPDTRFPNEIDQMKARGFDVTSIRVNRVNFESGLTEEQKNHCSEVSLDDYAFDYVICNDKLEAFHAKLAELTKNVLM